MTKNSKPRLESLNRVVILIVITSLSYAAYTGFREQTARDQFYKYRYDHNFPFWAEHQKQNSKQGNIFDLLTVFAPHPELDKWAEANRQWTEPLERNIRDAKNRRQTAVFLLFLLAFILPIYYLKKRKKILRVEESTASPD